VYCAPERSWWQLADDQSLSNFHKLDACHPEQGRASEAREAAVEGSRWRFLHHAATMHFKVTALLHCQPARGTGTLRAHDERVVHNDGILVLDNIVETLFSSMAPEAPSGSFDSALRGALEGSFFVALRSG
jgi:hypothetical protein